MDKTPDWTAKEIQMVEKAERLRDDGKLNSTPNAWIEEQLKVPQE